MAQEVAFVLKMTNQFIKDGKLAWKSAEDFRDPTGLFLLLTQARRSKTTSCCAVLLSQRLWLIWCKLLQPGEKPGLKLVGSFGLKYFKLK